ncbi:ATP-binding protein [Streptomyces globosus]|jgi:hypothetical protein|uniref:ATP-binding protein n=1 Tax=Streptomyces globosus TaxID=68209 RepID=UPI0031CEAE85
MSEDVRRLSLGAGTSGIVARCRDFTRQALADWHWPIPPAAPATAPGAAEPHLNGVRPAASQDVWAAAVEDVLLMVSELVGNACLHAGGPDDFVLRHSEGLLRVEVGDGSPEHPRRRTNPNPALPGGHGLLVVDRLARSWGWDAYPDGRVGKTVWAEVAAPAPPP